MRSPYTMFGTIVTRHYLITRVFLTQWTCDCHFPQLSQCHTIRLLNTIPRNKVCFPPHPVPYDPPNNVSVAAVSSTSIRVQWSPPSIPNGVIIHYSLYINDLPAITIPASTGRPSQSWVVDELTDDSELNVSLSASTKIGEGPLATVANVSTTSQHGEILLADFLFVTPRHINT